MSGEMQGGCDYLPVPSDTDSIRIYELRVKLDSGVKTRRMSVRQIGEGGESKSTCYVVTYDDMLVIKIPPSPLVDFYKYLENINIERKISEQLFPDVQCLSPSLSSILCKVPELSGKLPKNTNNIEDDYIDLLTREPRYQGYLKIGDRFAFFMSLSKHPFFDQVIEKIHGDKKWMQDEIVKNRRLFENLDAFETVYGSAKIDLYCNINDMFNDFSRKIDGLLDAYNGISFPDYQRQEWLFAKLAEKKPEFDKTDLPPKLCDEVDIVLDNIINEKDACVGDYRQTFSAYIRKKNFDKNRIKIESFIIKTLELIYRLKQKGVAARDLKPDNILVISGDSGGYSQLSGADNYELGLIDLETAVSFRHKDALQILQPMLAGTPAYMTPSHVFSNQVLVDVFGREIQRIFYAQDWFSAIGMIYDLAAGEWLFKKTARLIPEIMRAQRKGIAKKQPSHEILANVSKIFWQTAEDELFEKINSNQETLQNIHLALPDHIIDMFMDELQMEKKLLKDMIAYCGRSQKFFPKAAQKFIDASYEEIRAQRMKLESPGRDDPSSPDINQRLIKFLELVENMKFKEKEYAGLEERIKQPITCDELLIFLFYRVLYVMYRYAFFKTC